jgi:sarcosine oxidase subunit gamma
MLDLSNARQSPALFPSGVVRLLPATSRFILRGAREVMAAAGGALGLNISASACRSARRDSRSALWLGPDEQLLLVPVEESTAVAGRLNAALATLPHSLVDVSHRQIAIEVGGPLAQTVLNAGCPLDLFAASFPVGMCTRTVLGKVDIVLWRTGADTFHVEVWRSFAEYAARYLAEAARELAG